MTLAFVPTVASDSPVARLDARWRLAALTLAIASTIALRGPAASAAALAGALGLVAVARLPLRWVLPRLGGFALAAAPFVLVLPFAVEPPAGGSVWHLGPLRFWPAALPTALALGARALAIGALVLVLLGSAPLTDTLRAAQALGVPGLLVHLTSLSYRYTFLLRDEFVRLRTALRTRGFRNRADLHSYRTVGRVTGTLLVRGAERAERVAQAMRCRGFDGRFRTLTADRTRPADVLAFAMIAGAGAALLGWDWCSRP